MAEPFDQNLCILPRWAAGQGDEWYPWLLSSLELAEGRRALRPPPPSGEPSVPGWVAAAQSALTELSAEEMARTVLVGHSVGCQAALRTLAAEEGPAVAGCLMIAGWWTVDSPWDALLPWQEPFDVEQARERAGKVVVLLSDDDPFTADHEVTAERWRSATGAEVELHPGKKHFNGPTMPVVLDALRRHFG